MSSNSNVLTLDRLTSKLAKAEIYQNIQVTIAEVLAGSPSVKDVIPRILHVIATSLNMELAVFWRASNKILNFHSYWQSPLYNFEEFVDTSKKLTFGITQSVPGRVLSENTPVWITNYHTSKYIRSELAKQEGLRTALAFPIMGDLTTIGVVEMFSINDKEADEDLLSFLVNIGYRVGQYIKRRELEKEITEQQLRYEMVKEYSPVAIIISDTNGIVVDWNLAAEDMFGWRKHQIVGQSIITIMPERFRAEHIEGMARIRNADETYGNRFIGKVENVYGLHKNGQEFGIISYLTTWKVNSSRFYSATITRTNNG